MLQMIRYKSIHKASLLQSSSSSTDSISRRTISFPFFELAPSPSEQLRWPAVGLMASEELKCIRADPPKAVLIHDTGIKLLPPSSDPSLPALEQKQVSRESSSNPIPPTFHGESKASSTRCSSLNPNPNFLRSLRSTVLHLSGPP